MDSSTSVTKVLTWRYLLALSAIAVLTVLAQMQIQGHLENQEHDSEFINTAGRQRMLSQRIAKAAALVDSNQDRFAERDQLVAELQEATRQWRQGQAFLEAAAPEFIQDDDPLRLRQKLKQAGAKLEPIALAADALAKSAESETPSAAAIATILASERDFLTQMETVVDAAEVQATRRVQRLRAVEFVLLVAVLGLLILEAFIVFRPAVRRVSAALRALATRDRERQAMLRAVPDPLWRVRTGESGIEYAQALSEAGEGREAEVEQAPGLLEALNAARATSELVEQPLRWPSAGADEVVEARVTTLGPTDALVLVRTIDQLQRVERKLLASLDDERRRLGRELHDGVCQTLAGLALMARGLESSPDPAATSAQLAEFLEAALRDAKNLSQGLQAETQDLDGALSALADAYGTMYAIAVVCSSDTVDWQLTREQSHHVLRIAGEAMSNALRHAGPTRVELWAGRRDGARTLVIEDDGGGLNPGQRPMREAGGLFSMRFRANAIGAELRLDSLADKGSRGTRVVVELPRNKRAEL